MNHALPGIPDRTAWNFLLVRFDRRPDMAWKEHGYSEVATSRNVKWPKGMKRPKPSPNQLAFFPTSDEAETPVVALFIRQQALKLRLEKLGYTDVTYFYDAWLREQAGLRSEPPPKVTEIPPRVRRLPKDKAA